MEYLDFLGRPLAVGDYVILIRPHYRELLLARINKFTPQKVLVRWSDRDQDQLYQISSQLCKVEGPDLTLYLLKN